MGYNKESISLRIKQLREEKQMDYLQFSELTGVDNSTLSKIEKGKLGISLDAIVGISSNCGVSLNWLIYGVEDEHIDSDNTKHYKESLKEISKKYSTKKSPPNSTLLDPDHEQVLKEIASGLREYAGYLDGTERKIKAVLPSESGIQDVKVALKRHKGKPAGTGNNGKG